MQKHASDGWLCGVGAPVVGRRAGAAARSADGSAVQMPHLHDARQLALEVSHQLPLCVRQAFQRGRHLLRCDPARAAGRGSRGWASLRAPRARRRRKERCTGRVQLRCPSGRRPGAGGGQAVPYTTPHMISWQRCREPVGAASAAWEAARALMGEPRRVQGCRVQRPRRRRRRGRPCLCLSERIAASACTARRMFTRTTNRGRGATRPTRGRDATPSPTGRHARPRRGPDREKQLCWSSSRPADAAQRRITALRSNLISPAIGDQAPVYLWQAPSI